MPNDVTLLALSESVVGVSQGHLLFSKKRVEVGPVIQKYVVLVAVVVVFTVSNHQFLLFGHQSSAKRRNSTCSFRIRCRCVSGTNILFKKTRRSRTGHPEICSIVAVVVVSCRIINFHFLDTKVVPNDVTIRALSKSVVGVSQGQIVFSKMRVEVGPVIQTYVV